VSCFSPLCPPSSGTCRRNKIFRNPSGDWPPQHQQLPDYGRGPDAESEMCGVSGSWRFEREPVVKLVHGPAGNSKITTSRKHVRGLAADTRNKHARCFTCSGVQPPTYCIDKAFDFELAGLNLAVSTFHGLHLSENEGHPVFFCHIYMGRVISNSIPLAAWDQPPSSSTDLQITSRSNSENGPANRASEGKR
jgi:hypothetical protein